MQNRKYLLFTVNGLKICTLSTILLLAGCGGGPSSTLPIKENDVTDFYYNAQAYDADKAGLTISRIDSPTPIEPTARTAIGASSAGDYIQQTSTKAPLLWNQGHLGQGVTIGFVDSGINPNHIDFYNDNAQSRVLWQQARGIKAVSNDPNEEPDGLTLETNNDYVDIDTDIVSGGYHGTHISSIAAGRNYGLAPEANIIPVNVFFDNASAFNTAIHTAVAELAPQSAIINASITNMVNLSTVGAANSEFNAYLTTLKNNDSVLVTAAGNGGEDNKGDPIGAEHFNNFNSARNLSIIEALENQVLHVIALETTPASNQLNNQSKIADFSNYPGRCSDVKFNADASCDERVMSAIQNNFIAVPGTSIEAANGVNNTDSIAYSGTSMATPVVSGGLALLLSAWEQLTPTQAVAILKESANNEGIYTDSATYGVGLMDLEAAITPLGKLKSSASASEFKTTSATPKEAFTLSQSAATLPSELAALAKAPALNSVAYFDKYNRDFAVDLTRLLKVQKQSIDWHQYWAQTPYPPQDYQFDSFALKVAFNPNKPTGVAHFNLRSPDWLLSYQANSTNNFVHNTQLDHSHFIPTNQQDYGHSFSVSHQLSNKLSLQASLQNPLSQANLSTTSISNDGLQGGKYSPQSYALGFNLQLTPQWQFMAASQFIYQEEGFNQAQGSGVFAFGEQAKTQQTLLSLSYKTAQSQLYTQFSQGNLKALEQPSGSYFNIHNADYSQLRLGMIHHLNNANYWGLEAYNNHTLMQANIALNVPTGMNANGQVLTEQQQFKFKNTLIPDSLQFFYKSQPMPELTLQWNTLITPDDQGLGLYLTKSF